MFAAVRLISLIDVHIVVKLMLELMGGAGLYFAIAFLTKNETFFMIFNKVLAFAKRFFKKDAEVK